MIVRSSLHGEDYNWPTHTNSLLIDRKDSRGTEALLTTIRPGKATHDHSHAENEQLYYVTQGAGQIKHAAPGKKPRLAKIRKGDVVFIPLRTMHQVACRGRKPLRYITVDIFPGGKPKSEPTWAAHARKLAEETK